MEVNPLSVILVKSDSKGDRLLFRYPYNVVPPSETSRQKVRKSPYSLPPAEDLQSSHTHTSNIYQGNLSGFTDEVLSTLFAVKQELCNRKFELKVNDVRFVSHPTLMQPKKDEQKSFILVNIVFALHAQASYSIVKCYYELSKRLGIALFYEEDRAGYLSDEMKIMVKTHDEVATISEQGGGNGITPKVPSVFDLVLERSSLAQCLKTIYHDLCTTGLLSVTINQWMTLSFCLPQKAHQFHKKGFIVEPEAIDRCLESLKPYHGMLLLVDPSELLDCFPPSGARMLIQLIEVYNPLKSLQNMATDADLAIEHLYQLVGHLVYWAKATIIYPLCETNVYVIAPDAPLHIHSPLVEKFKLKFPRMSLFEVISDFSLPTSIGHLTTPLQPPARQGRLAEMVLWMLQHHLLMQLHTYVQFMPTEHEEPPEMEEQPTEFDAGDNSISPDDDLHAGSLLSMSSQPMPVPNTSRRSLTDEHFSESILDDSTVFENIAAPPSSSHKSNYSTTQSVSLSTDAGESLGSAEDEEKTKELLLAFNEPERSAVRQVPAASNIEDLALMVKLYQAGYFAGNHHLEEIIYFENLRRSQLLQLLDKFKDVLIIYETEDPAIANLYTQT
ncbi:GATOR complex protein NPRL3 isoform X2 [Phlebotomus argentipes]|uniref:GATOR complex protein NPRL3 isoform X2 n=1 Tax=Phlebotomus argentipes TaxID=94469 RepID=UPI002892F164|nr:GATOR complex protein NPRL3 isoform X2 [Phlebotomus argentipes]